MTDGQKGLQKERGGTLEELQKQKIEQEVRKYEDVVANAGYSVDQLTEVIANIVEGFTVVFESFKEQMERLRELFEAYNFTLEEIHKTEVKRDLHKINFTRPVIRHQVIDRKPKRLIKKVIH